MQKDFYHIRIYRSDYIIFKAEALKKDDMKFAVMFNKMMKKCFPKRYSEVKG